MKNYMKEIVNDFFSDNEEEEPKAYLILGKKSDYRSMDISNKSTDAMMSSVNLLYDKVDKNSIDWGALVANSANIELRGLDETMEDEKTLHFRDRRQPYKLETK